jgi:hypothetical protein
VSNVPSAEPSAEEGNITGEYKYKRGGRKGREEK